MLILYRACSVHLLFSFAYACFLSLYALFISKLLLWISILTLHHHNDIIDTVLINTGSHSTRFRAKGVAKVRARVVTRVMARIMDRVRDRAMAVGSGHWLGLGTE